GDPHLDLLVTRLLCLAARVTNRDRHDARQFVEDVLHAPEAAARERGGLGGGCLRTRVTEERAGREGRKEKYGFALFASFAFDRGHAFAPTPTGQVTPVPPSPQYPSG